MCILMPYKWLDYRIAENFWGRKLLWIGEKYGFHGETFCGFLTCAAPKDVIPQISRVNLSMSSHKTVKICESLLPRRFCYTAFCQKKFHNIWWYSISIKIAQIFSQFLTMQYFESCYHQIVTVPNPHQQHPKCLSVIVLSTLQTVTPTYSLTSSISNMD